MALSKLNPFIEKQKSSWQKKNTKKEIVKALKIKFINFDYYNTAIVVILITTITPAKQATKHVHALIPKG